jgi:hypothetical protein
MNIRSALHSHVQTLSAITGDHRGHHMELRGTLNDFSLEVIFGLIGNGHKTGKLHLMLLGPEGGVRDVNMSFNGGEIGSVSCGALHGLDALREAAVCPEGSFDFAIDGGAETRESPDPISMESALAAMEAARSEVHSLAAALSTPGATLRHAFPPADTISLSPEEFRVLAVLRDGMTVNEVVAASTAPTVDAMRIIRQLIDRGLLTTGSITSPQTS